MQLHYLLPTLQLPHFIPLHLQHTSSSPSFNHPLNILHQHKTLQPFTQNLFSTFLFHPPTTNLYLQTIRPSYQHLGTTQTSIKFGHHPTPPYTTITTYQHYTPFSIQPSSSTHHSAYSPCSIKPLSRYSNKNETTTIMNLHNHYTNSHHTRLFFIFL